MKARYPHALKRIAQVTGTGLWTAGFGLLGRLRRPPATPWSSVGNERVLVVAPHPDDETVGCAGTILCHRDAGDRVTVVCVTDGRRSSAFGLTPEAMADTRRQEAGAAAALLDFELAWLGLPEGAWSHADGVGALTQAITRVAPTRIYAPTCLDYHPEHRNTACALAGALAALWPANGLATHDHALVKPAAPDGPPIYGYPIGVPFRTAMIDQVASVASYEDRIRAAFDAYTSQRGAIEPALRWRRYMARRFRYPGLAEGFWARSASCYCRLHTEPRDGGTARGMRYLSWTDPLAFLSARKLRRELAALVPPLRRDPL